MKKNLMIIGAGTTAELVYEFVKDYDLFHVLGFAVDADRKEGDTYCGLPVYTLDEMDAHMDVKNDFIFVALFWNKLNANRKNLYERLKAMNKYQFANIISPHAHIKGTLTGDNCWFHDFVIVQYSAVIGNNVIAMPNALIAHHTTIHDHCFCNTQSIVASRCDIGEQTFIGIHASIFEGTTIGEKCLVGACAIVKRNLPAYSACKTPSNDMVIKHYDADIVESKLDADRNVR